MHVAFQKALANGSVYAHFGGNWDEVKYRMTKVDTFGQSDWDAKLFAWEQLRNGDIINDGVSLWRYVDLEYAKSDIELFEGRVIFLIEIDGD